MAAENYPPGSPVSQGRLAPVLPFAKGRPEGLVGCGRQSGCFGRLPGGGHEPRGQGGFTLLELTVVLVLMALMMVLVLPGLQRSYQRERDRASLRKLVVALKVARSEAATKHHRVRLFLDLKTGRYRLEGSTAGGRLAGLRLSDSRLVWQDQEKQHGYIAFYGDGSSSGGRLNLTDPTGQRHVVEVEVITGRVFLKSGET